MTHMKLFYLFFKFGLFTFGGGYAMITFMENTFVKEYKLIDSDTMSDFVATSQIVPGMIALNLAHLIGRYIKGFFGGFVAVIGVTLPSVIVITMVAYALTDVIEEPIVQAILNGILSAVLIVIIQAIVSMSKSLKKQPWLFLYSLGIVLSMVVFNVQIVWLLLISIGFGLIYYYVLLRKVMR